MVFQGYTLFGDHLYTLDGEEPRADESWLLLGFGSRSSLDNVNIFSKNVLVG